ncbi:hypothetical protein [Amycolatopsis sp. cmx-4-61]|uniref:hypothetical protein n=1 Tax=Amycolatopsis sp. cmx-4-61 TaxID=2790937 RepID=UPI00397E6232
MEGTAMDEPSAKDLALLNDETVGNVGFDVTDDQLRQVWRHDPHLVALARERTWGDTEIRDQLCASLEALGAHQLAPGQPATIGLRIAVATYPHRQAQPHNRSGREVAGELTDLVENAIVRSDAVRSAGAAVVVHLVGRATELPPFADAAVTFRVTSP